MRNKIIAVLGLSLLGGGSYVYLQNTKATVFNTPEAVLEKLDEKMQQKAFAWIEKLPFTEAMKNKTSLQIDVDGSLLASGNMPVENISVHLDIDSRSDFEEDLSELDLSIDLGVEAQVTEMGEAEAHVQLQTQLNKDFFVFQIPNLDLDIPLLPEEFMLSEDILGTWFEIPWEMLNSLVPTMPGQPTYQEMLLTNQQETYQKFFQDFKNLIPDLDIWEASGQMQLVDGWYEVPVQSSPEKMQASFEAMIDFVKLLPQGELYLMALGEGASLDFADFPPATGTLRVSAKDPENFTFEVLVGEFLKVNIEEDYWSLVTPDMTIDMEEKDDRWQGEIMIPSAMTSIQIHQMTSDWDADEQAFMIKGAVTNGLVGELFQFELDSKSEAIKSFDLEKPEAQPWESLVDQMGGLAQSFNSLGDGPAELDHDHSWEENEPVDPELAELEEESSDLEDQADHQPESDE